MSMRAGTEASGAAGPKRTAGKRKRKNWLWVLAAILLLASAFVAFRWVAQTRETAARAEQAYDRAHDTDFFLMPFILDQFWNDPPRRTYEGYARQAIEQAKLAVKPTLAKSTLAGCVLAQPEPPDGWDLDWLYRVTEIKTPVLILVCHSTDDQTSDPRYAASGCSFAESRVLDTTLDPAEAQTFLYLKSTICLDQGEPYRSYEVYVMTADGNHAAVLAKGDGFQEPIKMPFESNEAASDELFFTQLAADFTFSPDASDDVRKAIGVAARTYVLSNDDRKTLYETLETATLTDALNLADHPELAPTDYRWKIEGDLSLTQSVIQNDFTRGAFLYWNSQLDVTFNKVRTVNGLLARLSAAYEPVAVVREVVAAHLLGTYTDVGKVYEAFYRFTFVNLATGRMICWLEEDFDARPGPDSISADRVRIDDHGFSRLRGAQIGWSDIDRYVKR
ncbi:MAG: hypothetical protein GX418_07320 [Clostridiales bacterium]|nr:hypothetical protein [Clostridiales bacterium]